MTVMIWGSITCWGAIYTWQVHQGSLPASHPGGGNPTKKSMGQWEGCLCVEGYFSKWQKKIHQAKIKLWGDMQTRERVAKQRSLLLHQAQVSDSIHRIDYLQGDTCFAFTDSWTCLLLFLPSSSLGAVSLDTLLQMFVSQERVEGGTLKQNTFGKLPECLCFHVQRTGFGGGQPYKRHDYVEF